MIDVITCPHCQRRLALPPQYRDCDVQCPGCNNTFHVNADPPPTPAPPVATIAPEPLAALPLAALPLAALPAEDVPRPSIARRPTKPSPSWRGKAMLVFVCLGLVSMFVCGLRNGLWQSQQPVGNDFRFGPGVLVQPPAPRDQVVIVPGVEEPQTAQELVPVLQNLGRAFRVNNSVQLVAQFDIERARDRLLELGILPPKAGPERAARDLALRHDLQTGFQVWAPQLAWMSAEILHVHRENVNDVAVVVRHRVAANNTAIRLRWWLTRRPGFWSVYDVEDPHLELCFSALTGVVAEGHELAELRPLREPIKKLLEARRAVVVQNDANAAEQALQQIAAVELPPYLDAIRWAIAALVPMQRNQPKGVLDAVAKARALKVDLPALDLYEAIGYNRSRRYARAVPLLEAHEKLLGSEWYTSRELGDALLAVGRPAEACTAYRKSLDENPQAVDAFFGLLRSLGSDDPGADIEWRFVRLDDRHQQFEKLGADCRQIGDGRSLERLAQAMQKFEPNDASAHFALAIAKAWAEQPDAAVGEFRAGLAREPDAGKRAGQTTLFVQAMASSGLTLQAYAATPAPREAFHILAAEAMRSYRHDDLRLLVAAHAPHDPNDPLLPWYRGEVLVQRGQYAQADRMFAAALAKGGAARTADLFRRSRVLACYHTGKALAAYATIGPARQTFQELAALAAQDHDDALLERLIAVHAKAHADDPGLYRQRLHLKVRTGDLAAATALLREAQAAQARKQPERQAALDAFLYSMVDAGKALEAYAAAADVGEAFEHLAAALRDQERLAELRQLIAAHRKRHADDIWLDVYTGIVHLQERKWADAASVLAETWQKAPDTVRDRIRGDTVYALCQAGKALDAYRTIEPHAAVFGQLANLLLADKKGAELPALIEAYRPNAGDDAELPLIEARARVMQNQPAQAIKLWQDAYQREPTGWKRRQAIAVFVLNMHAAKQGLDAYRAAPDRRAAFETLAAKLVQEKNADELGKLLHLHNDPDHRWLPFYRGEHMLLLGHPDVAQGFFAPALAGAAPHERRTFRHGLFRAHVRAGWTVQAYNGAGRSTQAFRELASICYDEKNAAQLEAVIAAHRATDPDDPALLSWELQAIWIRGDCARALAHLDAHADEYARQPSLRYFGGNCRVRALVKLKRPAEAIRAAEALEKTNRGGHLLLLLAYAAAGDVKGAMAVMERAPPSYVLRSSYADPDVGPLLRSEALRAFRERYPEPPKPRDER